MVKLGDELASVLKRAAEVAASQAAEWPACTSCGEPVHPAKAPKCEPCRERDRDRRRVESDMHAPAQYDARFGGPELAARVTDARAMAVASRWTGPGVLSLVGPVHAGKSTLASAVARRIIAATPKIARAMWVSAPDLASARKAEGFGRISALEREAADVPLLVLDDVAQEGGPAGGTEADAIGKLIFRRAEAHTTRWTILTLGVAPDALVARYGAGVADRILRRYGTTTITLERR